MIRSKRILDIAETADGKTRFVTVGSKSAGASAAIPSGESSGAVGYKSESRKRKNAKNVESASASNVETAQAGPTTMTTSSLGGAGMTEDVLTEFVPSNNDNRGQIQTNQLLNRIYRDIYYHDSVCGSVVDLRSILPFSEFSLTGIRDEKMLMLFSEAVDKMNLQALLPQISVSYDVLGAFIASTSWDEQRSTYNGITPQNIDNISFTPVPIFGADPLMNLRLDEQTMMYLRQNDERMKRYEKFIPDDLKSALNNEKGSNTGNGGIQGFPLSPDHTIFIPRRGLMQDYMGVSLYKRVLPAWLVEKALIRGTLDQVYKRQRAVSHITVGEGDTWVPTPAEMQQISQLFLDADLDPVGAFVVTRSGVSLNDVRRGDDFWKWPDSYDQLSTIKLRALGTSETFLGGEASYSTIEQTLSVFMEQIRNHRYLITNELFYQKMFPSISKANNITAKRNRVREVGSAGNNKLYYNYTGELIVEIGGVRPSLDNYNPADYAIPRVQWHKRLLPEADREYLDLLNELSTKNVPIPIRLLAAAGGVDVRTLLEGKEDDIKLRRELKEYQDKIKEINPPAEGEEGDIDVASLLQGSTGLRRRSILNRNFEEAEYANLDSKGKRRLGTRKGEKVKTEKINKLIAEVASELAQQENARNKDDYTPKRTYSFEKKVRI